MGFVFPCKWTCFLCFKGGYLSFLCTWRLVTSMMSSSSDTNPLAPLLAYESKYRPLRLWAHRSMGIFPAIHSFFSGTSNGFHTQLVTCNTHTYIYINNIHAHTYMYRCIHVHTIITITISIAISPTINIASIILIIIIHPCLSYRYIPCAEEALVMPLQMTSKEADLVVRTMGMKLAKFRT